MAWPKGKPRRPATEAGTEPPSASVAVLSIEDVSPSMKIGAALHASFLGLSKSGRHEDAAAIATLHHRLDEARNAMPAAIAAAPAELAGRLEELLSLI